MVKFDMWFDKWFNIWFNILIYIWFNIRFNIIMVWYVVYWDLDLMMMLMAFFEMIPGLAGGLVTFFF